MTAVGDFTEGHQSEMVRKLKFPHMRNAQQL